MVITEYETMKHAHLIIFNFFGRTVGEFAKICTFISRETMQEKIHTTTYCVFGHGRGIFTNQLFGNSISSPFFFKNFRVFRATFTGVHQLSRGYDNL